MIYNLFRLLLMVLAYSMIGCVIVLYVVNKVSFCLPHFVEVNDFMMLIVLFAFSLVLEICSPKLSFGSKVNPKILGCFIVGIDSLLIVNERVLLNSDWSLVNSVDVDFVAFSCKSFSFVHSNISFR